MKTVQMMMKAKRAKIKRIKMTVKMSNQRRRRKIVRATMTHKMHCHMTISMRS
jgi:hypothetical protein